MSEEWFDDKEVPCQNKSCAGDGTAIWSGGSQKFGNPPPRQCRACRDRNDGVTDQTITCSNCRKEYTYKAKSIVWHLQNAGDWETPSLCKFCTEHPDLHIITLTCQNASHQGAQFEWLPQEQRFYSERGLEEPALCKECREANKAQRPETIKCEACEAKHTYSRNYIITWKRKEGPWGDRTVCKLCFNDPERAKRLKEEKEWKERQKQRRKEKDRREDTVGYYLRNYGTPEQNEYWRGIVDNQTYHVPSNVQSYDVLSEISAYAAIVERAKDGTPITSAEHIMVGLEREGHGWKEADFTDILGNACHIAEDTGDNIIECEDARSHYIVKYDSDEGVVAIICYNKSGNPPYRIKTSFVKSQEDVASAIRNGQWSLS